jgi:hypothetical protein
LGIANFRLPIANFRLAAELLKIGNRKLELGNDLAERVGFEPTERFPVHSISSAASSTTPAPLRIANFRLPIADFRLPVELLKIDNRKLAIGNWQ